MKLLTINDIDAKNKRVILRVDYNVPLAHNGKVSDETRIVATKPTIEKIIAMSPKYVVIISHLGRPNGKPDQKLSLKDSGVLKAIERMIPNSKIQFINSVRELNSESTGLYLHENIRFFPQEEQTEVNEKVEEFRSNLSSVCDIFVQDAFGCLHRPHSSIVGIDASQKVIGLLVEAELKALSKLTEKPLDLLILGGAKIKDKLNMIAHFIKSKTKSIIFGGAIANSILALKGVNMGASYLERGPEINQVIKQIFELAQNYGTTLHLPVDFVAIDKNNKTIKIFDETGVDNDWAAYDLGPKTLNNYSKIINNNNNVYTVFWNGPVGKFELPEFKNGTKVLLESLKQVKTGKKDSFIVIGGGDSASAASNLGYADAFNHISTGGGVTLTFLEGILYY